MAKHTMRDVAPDNDEGAPHERSIRDLRPSVARQRLQVPRAEVWSERPRPTRRRSQIGVWIGVGLLCLLAVTVAALVLLSSTTITVTPRTHVIPFDASNPLTAYPSAMAAAGTIPYTVLAQTFEDSTVVQASGLEQAEEKASGAVVIFNETERASRLIKNTRFQSPDGLVFRIPASVEVPAARNGTPGSAEVTVFADETGPKYNIPPTERFTLPGLKSSPDYEKIYAKSTTAFSGGFSGQRPAVSPSVLESSRAEIRGRLEEKTRELWRTAAEGSVAFPGLVAVSFETLPPTNEPGGGVRITERAQVLLPVFDSRTFAAAIAQAVSADAEGANIMIRFSDETTAQPVGTFDAANLGKNSITFSLSGRGQLVWQIDAAELQAALAGKEEAAFQPIVGSFPAIEEARARIMPFWKRSFPETADAITVTYAEPPQF